MNETLADRPAQWLAGNGPEADAVVCSRVSMSRNLADFPFPAKCAQDEKKRIEQRILNTLAEKNGFPKDGYYEFLKLGPREQQYFLERDLATPALLDAEGPRGVLVSADQSMSVLINGADHVRFQAAVSGLQPHVAWTRVNALDDALASSLDFAFEERLGYLTASVWLVGTGLKVEVILHLPGLTMDKSVLTVEQEVRQKRQLLEGVFGNIRNAPGDFYRLSNAVTLGKTEEELVFTLSQTARDILAQERAARQRLIEEARPSMEDRVGRALGVARGARLLEFEEAISLLSSIRMGVSVGLIEGYSIELLNRLMVCARPAHIDLTAGRALDELASNVKRADLFRAKFS